MQFELGGFQVKGFLSRVQPFDIHRESRLVKSIDYRSAVIYDGEYGSHFHFALERIFFQTY